MRVLVLHNEYQRACGEDVVFRSETGLLTEHGVEVRTATRHNQEIASYGFAQKVKLWNDSRWSKRSADQVADLVREFAPDIVHVHNFMPLWSPSVFNAARQCGAATVLTLHNYRLFCMAGVTFRDGHSCHDCLGRSPLPGVLHRCYQKSLSGSIAVGAMLASNRETWASNVDAYIALTPGASEKFVRAGLPARKIHVKANFIPDPLNGSDLPPLGDDALYVGQLSEVKGTRVLIEAWTGIDSRLHVLGTGPLEPELKRTAPASVVFRGWVPPNEVQTALRDARLLIVPSLWEEPFGLVILEAFAMGRPVLGSRQGAIAELVRDGETGLLFEPGDVDDLKAKAMLLLKDHELAARFGRAARREYLLRYTPQVNFHELKKIYRSAIVQRHGAKTAEVAEGVRQCA